jgi:hypothetical protein
MNQDVGIFEFRLHPFRIGHEIGRQIAAVELHALNHLQRGLEPLGLLDRDYAFLANLLHRVGNDVSDS